jgi:hypothetical protein
MGLTEGKKWGESHAVIPLRCQNSQTDSAFQHVLTAIK